MDLALNNLQRLIYHKTQPTIIQDYRNNKYCSIEQKKNETKEEQIKKRKVLCKGKI